MHIIIKLLVAFRTALFYGQPRVLLYIYLGGDNIKSYDPKEIAYLHNMVWISHDRRDFNQLNGSAQDMVKQLGFHNFIKIASLISQCYYLHSLYDDGDNELSKRYNRTDYDIQLFGELAHLFRSIYIHTLEPYPEKQGVLQSRWWYYFSRKDVPEFVRLGRVSIPFLRQQVLKVGDLKKGMRMGYILARAGYQHNRDLDKTEKFLGKYWEEAKSLQNNILMF